MSPSGLNPGVYGLLGAACFAIALIAIGGMRAEGFVPLHDEGAADAARPKGLAGLIERLALWFGPRLTAALSVGRRESIDRRLDYAGRPGQLTVQGYVGRQAAYVVLGVVGGGFFALLGSGWFFTVVGAVMGWGLPEVTLSRTGRLRQERIDRDLPDFLDILAVTVRAGLGYRLALERVAHSLGGPVGEEMITALRQMGLGKQRREAFEGLRDRNKSEPLKSFVGAQMQAEELGVPLADALNDIAIDMRRLAHQAARRRAQRAAPRVSLITTTLIVPGSMILLLISLLLGSGVLDSGLLG